MGKYDTSSKHIIHTYNQAWAEWILQAQEIEVIEELSGEFQFIARLNDSLLKVESQNGPFLVLTELQFIYDGSMPERLAAYKTLAHHKYKLPVYVSVVYFLPPKDPEAMATVYHDEFMGQVAHIDFQVIKLWDLEAKQVLEYNNPMLLPFVPLMRGGNTKQIVRRCAKRIRQQPETKAAELEAILAIFASHVLDIETIRQILRWEMQIVQESPIIKELRETWLEQGIEQGLKQGVEQGLKQGVEQGLKQGVEQGVEQGLKQGIINALNLILSINFQTTPGIFDDHFQKLDVESLQALNKVALTVPDLAEFEKALLEMLSQD